MSAGRAIFQLGFEISPIILTGGIAAGIMGGMLPIVALTEAANFLGGILSGGGDLTLDNFFAHFWPVAGSTLIENDIGTYPFANQTVAANAIITEPLRISLRMDCPARGSLGYAAKLATMTALQAVLAKHTTMGGSYTVVTPSFIWTNCLLVRLADISGGDDRQAQTSWQWDFTQPLITQQQAEVAQNNLMSTISNQTQTDGSISGAQASVGAQGTLAAGATQPAAIGQAGINAASPGLGTGATGLP